MHDLNGNGSYDILEDRIFCGLLIQTANGPVQSLSWTFAILMEKTMFTHVPANCVIKIFTVSGVLVDVVKVDNTLNNATAYWDLKSREGWGVAAGMYLYHVQDSKTGFEKLGKFAILK